MKEVSISRSFMITILLLATIILLWSQEVNSQDSCSSNLNSIPFPTASLKCGSVWKPHGFTLRHGRSPTNSSIWSFVLSADSPNSFVAVGFSTNGRMVGSSAVVGWVSSDGTSSMKRYYLGGTSPSRVEVDQGNLTLVADTSSISSSSSRLDMAFQLVVPDGTTPTNHLLYAVGPDGFYPVSPNWRLMEHRDKISTSLNYNSGSSASKSSPYLALRRTHGVFNMLGWGILMIIGVMVARYGRQWDPQWFYIHAGIQSTALLMGITGVLCGFLLDNRLNSNVSTHKGLGIFIFVLGLLQAMALLARPSKTAKNRKYWNWYHFTVGRSIIVFAIANVFYGIKLGGEGHGWTGGYAFVICVLFITSAVLEYRLWTSDNI